MILEDKTQVAELINRCLKLKDKIKPKNLEIYNSSFIDQKFSNQECDIVYKKKGQQIFFLIEHQSKVDYSMPKRILKYQIAIMEMSMKNKKITQKKIKKINRDILIRVIKYIYNETLGEEKAKDIINKLERLGDKEMIIEVIKKDREMQFQKGEKCGEKLGIAKAIAEMVKEMINNNLSDEQIMKIAKIDSKKLEKLKMA